MLVLSRKLGERIWIGENISIVVVDICRDKVRIGIEAPKDVPIYRQELLDEKTMKKNAEAEAFLKETSPKPPTPVDG
jgi:carbon storage regulator